MVNLRYLLVRSSFLLALGLMLALAACSPAANLRNVSIGPAVISPNGDGVEDEAIIEYTLQRKSTISIKLVDAAGKEYTFRRDEERSAGSYAARFNGTYSPNDASPERKVMPDGEYDVLLHAVVRDAGGASGQSESLRGRITLRDGDTTPPLVKDVVSRHAKISPDGDALDDETDISYALSKKASVTITAVDSDGRSYLLDPPTERSAALFSHTWNGTSSGILLPDSTYTVHIQAEDTAGNISEATTMIGVEGAGAPRLEITRVSFSPPALPRGGELRVEIRVRNNGDVPLWTIGPTPGTAYDTDMNFNSWKEADGAPVYFERAGVWRVGVEWGQAGRPYPIRWALIPEPALDPGPNGYKPGDRYPALQPGQEAVITGTIQVNINRDREVYFWVSAVQEGVGFPGGRVGQQKIVISQ